MTMFSFNNKIKSLLFGATLLASCAAEGQNINFSIKTGPLGLEVNTFSGNLHTTRTDDYMSSRLLDMVFDFHYNSFFFDRNYGFGNGWTSDYTVFYSNDTLNGKTIFWGNGREDKYTASGSNYIPPAGIFDSLVQYQPNKFLLIKKTGAKFYFDNNLNRRITRIQEPHGNFLTLAYTDSLLTSVTNAAGQSVSFSYNSSGNLVTLTDATTSPARVISYQYDGSNNLTQVTDAAGGKYKYAYLVNGPMKLITDRNNNSADIIYYPDFTVSEVIGCNKRQSYSYDTTLQITTETDYVSGGENQITKYGYGTSLDKVWLKSLTSNCCGYNMSFEYDGRGNKIKQTDANGNVTRYTYDNKDNVLTETDALNQTYSFTYSPAFNHIASITDPKGSSTTLVYNAAGSLTQLTMPGNLVYTATYAANGDLLTSTDPKGHVFTYNYDTYGRPVSVTGPNSYHSTLGYNARGNLLSYTDAGNNTTGLQYDILDRLKKATDPLNNNMNFSYDAEGNITGYINQNNELTGYSYDASNRLVHTIDPAHNDNYMTYDAMDNLTSVKNALGNSMALAYDARSRITSIKDPLGNTVNLSYDNKQNITGITLPNGRQLSYTYDALDRLKTVSDLSGQLATLAYDKNNRIVNYTDAAGGITAASYDSLDRVTQITDPAGKVSLFNYDKASNLVTYTDKNGVVQSYSYDSLNRLKTITDKTGGITTYGYDNRSNVVSLTDQDNHTTSFVCDSMNRVKTETFPDGKTIQYTYDRKGNAVTKKIPDGTVITYVYDSVNRVTSRILPGGETWQYTYDGVGRVLTAANPSGTVSFGYDALNRVISENYGGKTTRYSYNTAGKTQTIIYPDSTVIIKTFDSRNNLVQISKNNSVIVSYQYDNADRMINKTFANGITSFMQYDAAGRLLNYNTGNGTVQNAQLTYDNERNRTSVNRITTPTKSEQFTYDNGNRLSGYKRGVIGGAITLQNTYAYDALGNRVSANLGGNALTYSINNLNQVTNSNGSLNINYTYDNNGNLTYDGWFYKAYDAEGRLMKDSASPAQVITYAYDAFGRRVRKTSGGNILKYTYAGLEQIEERDGADNLKTRTIFANFLSPVSNEKNGNSFYLHQNELNSVEAITNSAGAVAETYQYDPYGKQAVYDGSGNLLTGSQTGNRFGFTGQEYDSADNNNHFYFRSYNPETGLFNGRDPLGYADGTGMYQYVHDNPANGVDVFGLDDCDPPKKDPPPPQWIWYTDPLDWELFLSGQLSNTTSILEALQKSSNIWKSGGFVNSLSNSAVNFASNSRALQALNGTGVNALLVPFNIVNTVLPAYDLLAHGGTNNGAQNSEDVFNVVSSGTTTAVGVAGLNGTVSAGSTVGVTTVGGGLLFAAAGTAGGLGIAGIANWGYKKATGESFFEVGYNHDIPGFTSMSRGFWDWVYDVDDVERGADRWQKLSKHGRWDDWSKARGKLKEAPVHMPNPDNGWRPHIIDCPQNKDPNQPHFRRYWYFLPNGDSVEVVQAHDPNLIIGPDGVPQKAWVSVHDRLPYTILYENSKSASAPAKFVRITSPIEPKEDANTFQLGTFGFNNQTFSVPTNAASYYQRLDARDSLGLYVDVTAGYDQVGGQAFWEFQSIDPVTLLPPSDPLKGFLLLQDSSKGNAGHGFVNFSIKPTQTAVTLDTIGARAAIVFDTNDTIPTNIAKNTIDAFAPTSHMNALPATSNNPVALSWGGTDDPGGCGVWFYTLYVSTDGVNYNIIRSNITRTDTTFTGTPNTNYSFFVLATDSVGNTEVLASGHTVSTFIGAVVPVTWLHFSGITIGKDNLLNWSTATEQNSREFKIERSLNANIFTAIGTQAAAGNSTSVRDYTYRDRNIDLLKAPVMYYRIKQVDINGNFRYSNIIRLTYDQKGTEPSIVYPNPTQGLITVTIGDPALIGTEAVLTDANGRLLEQVKITGNSVTINLGKYVDGTYYIRLSNKEVLKVVKL